MTWLSTYQLLENTHLLLFGISYIQLSTLDVNVVEAAGIEPASASPPLRGLHAYSVFSLAAGYPTGRENLQPVQQEFNGSDPEHVLTAVLCR